MAPLDLEPLRRRRERRALVVTIIALLVALPVLALVTIFSYASIGLLIATGMVYVTLARGRLLGTSIRAHEEQMPHVHAIVARCATALAIEVPQVFVREDDYVAVAAVGVGEPYSIVVSTKWLRTLDEGELTFAIARELAHIALGHTRFTSLLSINGRENSVVAIAFGAWLRETEYSADRVATLIVGSCTPAIRSIVGTSVHGLDRSIDLAVFAAQRHDLANDATLRVGEWLGAMPYAINRIAAIETFVAQVDAARWHAFFEERARTTATRARAGGDGPRTTFDRAGAGLRRRSIAAVIDGVLIQNLVPKVGAVVHLDVATRATWLRHLHVDSGLLFFITCFAYATLFVGIGGRTFGMLVMDLRVLDARAGRIGIAQAALRYVLAVLSVAALYPLVRIFARVQPFERWSRTRLFELRRLAEIGNATR